MPSTDQLRAKLIDKLKELFQLNQPDLDFGFYRIMHAKAEQVTSFIDNDLLSVIRDAFGQVDEDQKKLLKDAIDKEIQLAKEYGVADPENSPKVLEAKARYEAAKDTASAEAEIYDHLYRFFERYYDDGDFISRRYYTRETPGKAAPFAIPYNGEEVKLHWANADQYYIKSTDYFSNYRFNLSQGIKKMLSPDDTDILQRAVQEDTNFPANLNVIFRIVDASEGEHGNIKGSEDNKRFFIIHKSQPVELTEAGELIINFEYRSDPQKTSQENTWRDAKNIEAVETIFHELRDIPAAEYFLRGFEIKAPTDKKKDRTLLEKYIYQYTARNTRDYFIHKDLSAFLKRELDFYIKNEVMRLDDIENADAPKAEDYLAKIKVLRKIASKLIEFMAQLENFQKKLWLKKKFIVETNYCITLDRIPEDLYPEVIASQAQHDEWIKLFAIDDIEGDTTTPAYSYPLSLDFLKANNKLVLDTRFFDDSFKARLLSSMEDFDEQCDGLLIHSENFQALNLLQDRYREQVKCIYIDPPYNTSEETFIYKNSYRHSSWLTMLSERCQNSKPINTIDGALIVTIDDEELYNLKEMLETIYGEEGYIGTIIVQSNPRGRTINSHYATSHEYCLVYTQDQIAINIVDQPLTDEQTQGYNHGNDETSYRLLPFRRSGGYSTPADRPNSEFSLFYSKSLKTIVGVGGPRLSNYPDSYESDVVYYIPSYKNGSCDSISHAKDNDDLITILPIDTTGNRRVWRWSDRKKIILAAEKGEFIVKDYDGRLSVQLKDWIKGGRKPKSIWTDSKYDASSHGTILLADILGDRRLFGYPKSLNSTQDALHSIIGDDQQSLCLDYFAGSGTTGHAVINLNRDDDGTRKYILVEMGDYFDTVLKPRISKVMYSKDWKDGKPKDRDTGVSHCFKYLRLESYEDTLNNLVLQSNPIRDITLETSDSLKEDYLLHYMLEVESKGSLSLLNIDAFSDPSRYLLKVKKPGSDEYVERAVDLIETFNYLIGLRLVHLAEPQTFNASFIHQRDPDLPQDQDTRLVLDGDLKQAADGKWWIRKVEGWVPKNPYNPNDGLKEKVLIVWRKLTGNLEEDNLVLDTWFDKVRIKPADTEFDTIYVNGSNNLLNLLKEGDTWKVRLIEEEFMKRMWSSEGV